MHSNSSSSYRCGINNRIKNDSLQPFKMNLNFKVEVYPDLYSHIKSTRLEYPSDIIDHKKDDDISIINKITNNNNNNNLNLNNLINNKKQRRLRNPSRYVTQPITLIEIKELEEENNQHSNGNNNNNRPNHMGCSNNTNEKITLV